MHFESRVPFDILDSQLFLSPKESVSLTFFSLKSSATNDRDFEQIRGNLDKICRYSVDVQWSLVMKRVQNKKQLELCKQNYNRLIQFIALEKGLLTASLSVI